MLGNVESRAESIKREAEGLELTGTLEETKYRLADLEKQGQKQKKAAARERACIREGKAEGYVEPAASGAGKSVGESNRRTAADQGAAGSS